MPGAAEQSIWMYLPAQKPQVLCIGAHRNQWLYLCRQRHMDMRPFLWATECSICGTPAEEIHPNCMFYSPRTHLHKGSFTLLIRGGITQRLSRIFTILQLLPLLLQRQQSGGVRMRQLRCSALQPLQELYPLLHSVGCTACPMWLPHKHTKTHTQCTGLRYRCLVFRG